jgi:hypothetical protein
MIGVDDHFFAHGGRIPVGSGNEREMIFGAFRGVSPESNFSAKGAEQLLFTSC